MADCATAKAKATRLTCCSTTERKHAVGAQGKIC